MEQKKWLPKGPGRVSLMKKEEETIQHMATIVEKIYGALNDGSFPFVA